MHPHATFSFLHPSPWRHWRFVTRSIKRKTPTAPPRERSPRRTIPETIADVHAHIHAYTQLHERSTRVPVRQAQRLRSLLQNGAVDCKTARRSAQFGHNGPAHHTACRLTSSIVLDVCFPLGISRRACQRCCCCSGTRRRRRSPELRDSPVAVGKCSAGVSLRRKRAPVLKHSCCFILGIPVC